MKKKIIIVSFFVALTLGFSTKSIAQYYFYDNDYYDREWLYELGGSVGIMNCLTDIGGHKGIGKPFLKDLNLGNDKLHGSIFLTAMYKYAFGIRLEGTFGNIKATDYDLKSIATNSGGRYWRGLNFRSKISEISLTLELHPRFIFKDYSSSENEPPKFSPYLVGGIGYFHFNPQGQTLAGKWVDLQPLHTEGEGFAEYPNRKNYKLSQFNFPLGIGVRYEFTRTLNLRAEILPRHLRTDYLDDCSTRYIDPALFANYLSGQKLTNALILNDRRHEVPGVPAGVIYKGARRGDPKDRDSYFTASIKLSIILGREKRD